LSLDSAIEIDMITAARYDLSKAVPQQTFSKKMFRQPALAGTITSIPATRVHLKCHFLM
jgi:hypothetical protein